MRFSPTALALLAACGAPAPPIAAAPAPAPPAPPALPAGPVVVPPAVSAASGACAQTSVDLPVTLPPCAAPGAKELREVSSTDLAVEVTPSSARVKPGGSVAFTLTMKNTTSAPLKLVLGDPQQPVLQVLDSQDRTIEPLPGAAPVVLDPRCARVDCVAPPAPPAPLPRQLTLAPGGVARAHVTWRARRLAWPTTVAHVGCCSTDSRPPVDAGPLPPGVYRVVLLPPVSPNDSEQVLEHDEAQIEVAP